VLLAITLRCYLQVLSSSTLRCYHLEVLPSITLRCYLLSSTTNHNHLEVLLATTHHQSQPNQTIHHHPKAVALLSEFSRASPAELDDEAKANAPSVTRQAALLPNLAELMPQVRGWVGGSGGGSGVVWGRMQS